MSVGKMLLITNSVIFHKVVSDRKDPEKFLGKTLYRTAYDKLWLKYYGTRNVIWLKNFM